MRQKTCYDFSVKIFHKVLTLAIGERQKKPLLFVLEVHMEKIFSKKWFKAAGIRAIKTVAQTAIASIGTAVMLSDVNWVAVASASVLAGILSILTSLAGLPEVDNE
jgi:hypothetical protein